MSLTFLYILHNIILSLGLASSIVIDIFIIIVEKTRRIRGIEKKIIGRVMSYSFISSLFLFLIQLLYFGFIIFNKNQFSLGVYMFAIITTIISALLVFCTAVQKYYQFKILERYQEKYHHLSESFVIHHKEFRQTSIIIFTLWLALYISYILI